MHLIGSKEPTPHNTASRPQDTRRMRVLQQDHGGVLREQGPQDQEDIHDTKRQSSGSIGFRLFTPW